MSNVSPLPKPLPSTRSRVTNGSSLFTGDVDGRTAAAKRFRDVLAEIVSDLGGADLLSEGQRQLARRAAMMSVEAERMEAEAIATGAIDLDAYGTLADRLSRLFARIGLRRVPRAIGPLSIRDHLAQKAGAP